MDRQADRKYAAGRLNYSVAWLLLIYLGVFGFHHFYMGKWITGILYLLTVGFFGIGVFVDLWTLNGQVNELNRR